MQVNQMNMIIAICDDDWSWLTYAEKRIKEYARAEEKMWCYENKPCGYDVQSRRLGGILYRTEVCRRRLLDYAAGKTDSISELEEKILPYPKATEGIPCVVLSAQACTTVNRP